MYISAGKPTPCRCTVTHGATVGMFSSSTELQNLSPHQPHPDVLIYSLLYLGLQSGERELHPLTRKYLGVGYTRVPAEGHEFGYLHPTGVSAVSEATVPEKDLNHREEIATSLPWRGERERRGRGARLRERRYQLLSNA